jgi:hypothetical protein
MKKLLIILAVLVLAPITVNAASSVNTSFDDTECKLHVTGTFEGAHQAQVVYYINNNFEGENNGPVTNNQYDVELTLIYNTDTTIKVRVADENGSNEMVKDSVVVPACTPPAPARITEVFDPSNINSIVINNATIGFDQNDYLDIGIRTKEDIETYLQTLQNSNDPNYSNFNSLFNRMKTTVGEGNELKFFIETAVRDEHDSVIDYSNYDDGFVLNMPFPKTEYQKLKGLKIISVDENTYDKISDINYTYDETNEVFVLNIARPGVLLAYIDNTIANTSSNPNTGDNINTYFIVFILSTLGLITTGIYTKKKIFN